MKRRKIVVGIVLFAVACGIGFLAFAWKPAISPIDPPTPQSFDPAVVKRGVELALIGNCNVCHTASGGKTFAGGLPVATPFGTIYSTNITPDRETGIGQWSQAAFQRAMREGVDRQGRHLYPAFPYDHFTLVSDADNKAIYAYLMSREPVSARASRNHLSFPVNVRMVLAGWKLLFLHRGPYQPDAAHSESWNRGAYLVEGLGHCGACHTPRNLLGAEKRDKGFAGGSQEGWSAYALNASSPAPVPWDAEAFFRYLRSGWHQAHGVALGPMASVPGNLGSVAESDVRAIAEYMATIAGEPTAERRQRAQTLLTATTGGSSESRTAAAGSQANPTSPDVVTPDNLGAAIYASACANCHEGGRQLPFGGLNLALSTAVSDSAATNIVNIVLSGIPAEEGERHPIMPGFDAIMTDQQIVALLGYLRSRFANKPPWDDSTGTVRDARAAQRQAMVPPSTLAPISPQEK